MKTNSFRHAQAKRLGELGELAATRFLERKRMKILARNWRPNGVYQGFELDIIAQEHDMLVFVEVKTRLKDTDIPIHTAFSRQKQIRICKAAQYYLSATDNWNKPCRFDLVCVCGATPETFTFQHYEHVIELG